MAMQLQVIAGPDRGRTFVLTVGDTLRVGRGQATQTRLNDPHMSRVHCELQVEENGVTVVDASSAAGTLVNGKRVSRQQLQPGDVIQIGQTQLRLVGDDSSEQATLGGAVAKPKPAGEPLDRLSGQTLAHYEIGPVLAKGQTGFVFQARDTKDDRTVAFKVLQPEFSKDEDEMQRFVRAMKTMLPLRHPNLVAIYNAGKTGPCCWIAMEYVEGESLSQVIHRIGIAGMLDWQHALRVAIHISRALEFAQQHQIIHRNIAPPNILVRSEDKVAKLGDLMLAKALEGTMAQQITRPGEMVGDVQYMSPERTRGTADVDGRSDIYGLGATVYALLTGRPPFAGGSLTETVLKIRQAEPEKPRKFALSIPNLFEGTVLKMLAKRPEDRHQTAAELLTDLERVAKFQGLTV
ncbi:MAG TPA: FHA domain-containing serine/threonine-protein kinase [Gemmataceae bacterium]|jgi:serine/threonine protein kinase|nr:FHA domain-containing serine/threonine-protein kinase [Gemmataceae bacterium]